MSLTAVPRASSAPPTPREARAALIAASNAMQRAIDLVHEAHHAEARAREERQRENMAKHANTMRLAELRRASGERRINVSERWMADIIRHIASLDGGEQLAESVHEAVAKELGDKSWLR